MARTFAVANQKGGVAKTTSTQALGFCLAELGHRTLLVDLDPQACLTWSCGFDPDGLSASLHDVILGRQSLADITTGVEENLDLAPANIDLAGAEIHLLTKTGREFVLRKALHDLAEPYDAVLIDCPPSLGILTINGLTAAESVLIPVQCETLSHRGVGQLMETIEDVRAFTNRDLEVAGAIATLFDGRTRLAHEVIDEIQTQYEIEVLDPPIPKSVRVAEAPARGRSVVQHAPSSRPAVAYRELAKTLAGLL